MRILPVGIMLLGLIGCATSYHEKGLTGGFSETQLDDNAFRVTFQGNAYTSREAVSDYALLRSADLAIEHGYGYFITLEAADYSIERTFTVPTTSHTNINLRSYGNSVVGEATTTTYGGQTYHFSHPRRTHIIVCFREKPQVKGLVYDARFIRASMRKKYRLAK